MTFILLTKQNKCLQLRLDYMIGNFWHILMSNINSLYGPLVARFRIAGLEVQKLAAKWKKCGFTISTEHDFLDYQILNKI